MRVVVAGALAIAGCGAAVAPASGTSGADSTGPASTVGDGTSPTSADATSMGPTIASTTGPPDTSSGGSSERGSSDDHPFILESDLGPPAIECDLWAQDCPRGEKCTAWANDGGFWNATRCSPIADVVVGVGDPCTVTGPSTSGIDDCALGSMCWHIDSETNTGECVALCIGSAANPTCADPCTRCTVADEGVLILCLPDCDPLAQDCGRGEGCYPADDSFVCAPDASAELGALGDPCAFLNVCDPGLFCAGPQSVPGCRSEGCCAPYCDVTQADPCDALLPGTACVPWYEPMQRPHDCFAGVVGACLLPE